MAPAATARSTPASMWRRWKRQSRRQGTRSASRACADQPLSRPVQDLQDRARLHQHHDRRHQRGQEELGHEAEEGGEPHPPRGPVAQEGGGAEELGRVEHQHADAEERHGALGVDARPVGEERPAVEEVVGRHQVGVQRQRHAGEQEQEPERRGEVGHHPHEEVEPAQGVQARGAEEPRVLEVALAPAAVARRRARSGSAARARSCRAGRRPCAPRSRRGARRRPRRSRG